MSGRRQWATLAICFCLYVFSLLESSCYRLYVHFITSVILPLVKCLPSNSSRKLFVKSVEHKPEEEFSDGIRGDVQLGHFILLIVPFSQQVSRLTYLYFFSFLKWPLKLDCFFRWRQSHGSEQLTTPEIWFSFPESNKIQSTLPANFSLVTYLLFLVASIKCPDSTTFTGTNT